MDKIHELIEQLGEEILKLFPDATKTGLLIAADGYVNISVEKWNHMDGVKIEDTPRRQLWDQSKLDGKWGEDLSELQNAYCKKCGCLLEET